MRSWSQVLNIIFEYIILLTKALPTKFVDLYLIDGKSMWDQLMANAFIFMVSSDYAFQ